MKIDDNSKDTSVPESTSSFNLTLKSPLKGKNIKGSRSSAGNNSCLKSKTDEVESSLVYSASEQLEKPIPEPISSKSLGRRPNVTTSNQRNNSDDPVPTSGSDDFSDVQLTKRLKTIKRLITENINVERDTKKSFDNLNDLLRGVLPKTRKTPPTERKTLSTTKEIPPTTREVPLVV